eukprot:TRINITY_DN7650_c0_g1_i1.p1 TRINITY_DN7650_c0_g1~~TRINITY_DN7650_c0_g1_i1.p1  ORF type:complete len:282 (+),score=46.48 TRINITY_DN7650_c0_g1_i1:160-1005(+)
MNLPVQLPGNLPPLPNFYVTSIEAPFTHLDPLLPELELPVLDSPLLDSPRFQPPLLVGISSSVPMPSLSFEASRADSEWSDILTDLDSDVSPDIFQTIPNTSLQKLSDSDLDIETKSDIDTEVREEDEEVASSNVCRHVGCPFRSKNKKLKLQHRTAREHEKNKRLHLNHLNSRGKDCPLCISFMKDGIWKKAGDDNISSEASTPERKRKRTSISSSSTSKKKTSGTRGTKRVKKDHKPGFKNSETPKDNESDTEPCNLKEGLNNMDKLSNIRLLRSSELK